MKRTFVKAASEKSAILEVKYLSSDAMREIILRQAIINRPTLKEALEVLLEHVDVRVDFYPEDIDALSSDEMIDEIVYSNVDTGDSDYILYLENKSTGKVYIDAINSREVW